jgi:hypothetical protein
MLIFQFGKGAMTEDSHSMFRPLVLAWAFFFIIAIATAGECGGESMIDLHQSHWKNRLLLIFASSADAPAYKALKAEMDAQRGGIQERDLLVGEVLAGGQSLFAGRPIEPESADALCRRFSVREQQFTVLLIGKDGELKLRKESPTELTEIFKLIDSMPMRQQEMRERK